MSYYKAALLEEAAQLVHGLPYYALIICAQISLAVCIMVWQSLEMKPLMPKQPQTTSCTLVSESQNPLAREVTAEFFSDSCNPTATEKIRQAAKNTHS